ncbi:hypothetical protein FHS59_001474 [Algoriphagus iocasae]|uniref:Lipoprotein n=1 Tax=Algoriphagus iocasae TaxID=1836499 RepID=A0A841MKG6_9BACT|nr:hypothetical protein [Algoriphagus iocasae]MBB6325859.1 hypothetical protein [Algoriphagus iocasae]
MKNAFLLRIRFLFLGVFLLLTYSCKTDEGPVTVLEGSYLHVFSGSDESSGRVMTFSQEGKVKLEAFRNFNDPDKRCLMSFKEGNYQWVGEELTIHWTTSFGPDLTKPLDDEVCVPKEALISNFDPSVAVSKASFKYDRKKNTFILEYPCNDTFGNCVGPLKYVFYRD